MSKEIKRINIKEFREKGYLQELNRQFLHPLGLALEIIINDKTRKESLGGVWDSREDEEGIRFALNDPKYTDKERLESFKKKAKFIDKEIENRRKKRIENLGYYVEPISEKI